MVKKNIMELSKRRERGFRESSNLLATHSGEDGGSQPLFTQGNCPDPDYFAKLLSNAAKRGHNISALSCSGQLACLKVVWIVMLVD